MMPLVHLLGMTFGDHPLRGFDCEALATAPDSFDFPERQPNWVSIENKAEYPCDQALKTAVLSGSPNIGMYHYSCIQKPLDKETVSMHPNTPGRLMSL